MILSYHLREIGIHGQVHNWLMSFVSNSISSVKIKHLCRLQFFTLMAFLKDQYWVRFFLFYILFPSLYFLNTYIFFITSFLLTYKCILFFPYGSDIVIIKLSIANCINDLIYRFSCHSLSLNITKTYSIIFSKALSSITNIYFN